MNRTKGILAAGTLTGLVIITLLGLGFGNLGALASGGNDSNTAVQPEIPQEPEVNTTDPAAEEAVKAWQDYSAELEQTVRVMQEREAAYQSQLDQANGTIVNLQDQINTTNSAASSGGGAYYEDDDDDRYEHEEHESHEEHEEYEDDD